MKIVFIGCVHFSAAMLRSLLDHPDAEIVGVITRNKSAFNADFQDLNPLAKQADCPVFESTGNDQQQMGTWLHNRQPDVIYCLGWSFLLSTEILAIPPLGVVGYHPAALPQNRGRHPIIWALTLGLEQTASTFFLMDEGADSGDILSQESVNIQSTDDAGSLYQKLTDTAQRQLRELTSSLAAEKVYPQPQNNELANYWRKRSASDGCIDWRMSAKSITNLVRALSPPYPGAHCEYKGEEVKIWRAQVINGAPKHLEPGKVINVTNKNISVKCGDGAVLITKHTFNQLPEEGSYL